MGTASTKKFLKHSAGKLAEEAAVTTSAGAGDADKIPALNAAGVLDASIINGKNTSAGAGDAGKVPLLNASGILDDTIVNASVTAAANKLAKLDASGRLDLTVMPVGIGSDTAPITASEALAAGDFINIWNNGGTANVRKADASTSGKEANGFVLSAVANGGSATVHFEGDNNQVTGLTPGAQYLSATTPGKATATPPSGSGQVVQPIGVAYSATVMNFHSTMLPIVLA